RRFLGLRSVSALQRSSHNAQHSLPGGLQNSLALKQFRPFFLEGNAFTLQRLRVTPLLKIAFSHFVDKL
ncbi:MAG: hypothetical protein WB502_05285, partial [Thermoactinomyces sp.]